MNESGVKANDVYRGTDRTEVGACKLPCGRQLFHGDLQEELLSPYITSPTSFITMARKSPFQIDIPETDVLSYVFPPNTEPYDKPIWIDAAAPEKSLSPKQLLKWVKRLGVGLDKQKIGQNEAVMIYSANHIFVPVAYLGIAGSGRVYSGCNPAYGVNGMDYYPTNISTVLTGSQRRSSRLKTLAPNLSLLTQLSSMW